MLRFSVLGSGSAGNSSVVCHGDTRVLIDAGLSAKQLRLRLEAVGIDPDSLDAVVLTHEHGDHCGGLDVFCKKTPLPVYGTRDTCTVVAEGMRPTVPWKKFEAGQGFQIGSLCFESFSVPHDAVDPVGFVIRDHHDESIVGVLSDVGQATSLIRDRLQSVDTLFIEANYDETMLVNDTRRPWATKQRISSRHGHLSNDQAAELIVSIASQRLHRVVLGHLSRDCNAPEVAIQAISEHLKKAGWSDVVVECARQREPLPLRQAAKQAAPSDDTPEVPTSRVREAPVDYQAPAPSRPAPPRISRPTGSRASGPSEGSFDFPQPLENPPVRRYVITPSSPGRPHLSRGIARHPFSLRVQSKGYEETEIEIDRPTAPLLSIPLKRREKGDGIDLESGDTVEAD